ncbi:MAG: hypothetical protein ACM31L_01085 [Actinomycetota bacterium]
MADTDTPDPDELTKFKVTVSCAGGTETVTCMAVDPQTAMNIVENGFKETLPDAKATAANPVK